jgi:hypothetical protein
LDSARGLLSAWPHSPLNCSSLRASRANGTRPSVRTMERVASLRRALAPALPCRVHSSPHRRRHLDRTGQVCVRHPGRPIRSGFPPCVRLPAGEYGALMWRARRTDGRTDGAAAMFARLPHTRRLLHHARCASSYVKKRLRRSSHWASLFLLQRHRLTSPASPGRPSARDWGQTNCGWRQRSHCRMRCFERRGAGWKCGTEWIGALGLGGR